MKVPFTDIEGLYIGNEWVVPSDREEVLNPATEEVLGLAPVGGVSECEQAIAAARHAFDQGPWPRMSFKERCVVMDRFYGELERRLPEIQQLIIREAGATVMNATVTQTVTPMRHLKYAIELASRIEPTSGPIETFPSQYMPGAPDSIGVVTTIREPVGVVAGITGYNFPFLLNMSKIVPALVTGNTIVVKPSPFTPFSALLFGEIARAVGLPEGVLNVVTGGIDVAKVLTSHPDVDLISFTGSDTVGAMISAQAAPTLKRVINELGGKSALIVRADADLTKAAMTAVGMFTGHAGQGCALLTRYLVHNSVRRQFVETCKAVAQHWVVGDPSDPATTMGPLIRASQRDKVEHYVQAGLDSGATLVTGGKRPENLDKGFFYTPTLFDDVDNASTIAQDEIFGPVGVTIGFDTDEEAIRIANDSKFGLAGAVMSADRATAYRMALQLRTGTVWVNGGIGVDMSSHAPFGGVRRSGSGREYGPGWLDEYMQQKVISLPVG